MSGHHVITAVTLAWFALAGERAFGQSPPAWDWRDLAYVDLRLPGHNEHTYAGIWADRLATNNDFYKRQGDRRFVVGNAPAVASAFVVRSPGKVVVLSVLNAASACATLEHHEVQQATIKRCPMRLVMYDKGDNRIMDAGQGCFLEFGDPSRAFPPDREAGSYAAYDTASRSIRTGLVVNGKAVTGCDLSIPVPRSRAP
jgi:hypothetical protein